MTDGPTLPDWAPDVLHLSKVEYVHEERHGEPPDQPRCAVCRDRVRPPVTPSGRTDSLLVCVLCWFDGDGREFWDAHRAEARSLVVCPRLDGKEPDRPADRDVVTAEFTFVVDDA